jgi:hypothetical protein
MQKENSNQRKRRSEFADGFRISTKPVVRSDTEREKVASAFGDAIGLPRVHGAPVLFAIARDPRTIFIYWSIDWSSLFAKTAPVDRQVHLRVYHADGIEEKRVAVEPMAANCDITVSRSNASYLVEIGYYQPVDVWNSVATSQEITTPPDSFADDGDIDLATMPLHLSFQRLLDLFGASKGDPLAKMISEFQTRALRSEEGRQLSTEEREILRAMDVPLPEIAAARRSFIGTGSEVLRKRTERFLAFGSTSSSRGFSESNWPSSGS